MAQQKMFLYGSIGIGLLGAFAAFVGGSPGAIIGGFLAFVGAVMAALIVRYGYIIIPLITQRTNTVVMMDTGFEIPPGQDTIVKKADGTYYASAFLAIRIYESAMEKSGEQNMAYNEYFERAVSNLKYITKISYLLYVEDITQKRKNIETKRAEAQLRLARERDKPDADVLKLDKYEREVAMWDVELTRMIKGVKPMGVIAYAMTTAAGVTKDGAIAAVKAQANELRTVLANALNVEVEWLTADEMLKCFEWEKFFPVTVQELEESVV